MFTWFDDKLMKINPDKYHLLVSTSDNAAIWIGNFQKENTKTEKLFGIQFDNKLYFDFIYQKYAKKLVENFML